MHIQFNTVQCSTLSRVGMDMTKYVTLAHRGWVNKKLKKVVKSKLTFLPPLEKTTRPQTNNTQRLAVVGLQ